MRLCLTSFFTQVANLILIVGMINCVEDLDLRIHHRSLMESAGLPRIIQICISFGVPNIDQQVDMLQSLIAEDERRLRERMDQLILKDMANPEDVYKALQAKTQGSKAKDYFLSMMQHLLLVREEGPALAHHFQLIDSMVADLVLDKKLGGAEQRLGHSVERIIAQFNEADRYQHVEDELAKAHASIVQLRLDKAALEDEMSMGEGGMVGVLRDKVQRLEDKLTQSRDNYSRLQNTLDNQRDHYEEQIKQLEAQIMELFRMLKEVGKGVDKIFENSGGMDRKQLIDTLERHFERDKTISILEGRDKRRRRRRKGPDGQDADGESDGSEDDDEDDDSTPRKNGSLRRRPASNRQGRNKSLRKTARGSEAANGRTSQFMDADDAIEQEQVQQQLAEGVRLVHCVSHLHHFFLTCFCSILLAMVLLRVREAFVDRLAGRILVVPHWVNTPSHPMGYCLPRLMTSLR